MQAVSEIAIKNKWNIVEPEGDNRLLKLKRVSDGVVEWILFLALPRWEEGAKGTYEWVEQ